MLIEQIYTGCLFQASYFIESNGESAVIDPLRESDIYLHKIKKTKSKLKYIFETHFHADFVSGHLTLSKLSGAPIIFGPKAKTNFQSIIAKDLQEFKIGDITIKVLHTPGHTIESTTYLLIDSEGRNHCIFTGDTLFLGDVGRPDLAQKILIIRLKCKLECCLTQFKLKYQFFLMMSLCILPMELVLHVVKI